MKISCIIQARTGSTRLKDKILMSLPFNSENTVLDNIIKRLKKSKFINKIIIASTTNENDKILEKTAEKNKIDVFFGSEENVLERFYLAAKKFESDILIRITGDCPCIDYKIIDKMIEYHIEKKSDYTTNALKRTFPHGLDVEIFNFNILEEAYKNANQLYELEHVTPYIYKTNPDKFNINHYILNENYSNIRITLDTKEDYNLLCLVYDYLYEKNNYFGLNEIINLFKEKNFLYNINLDIVQKKLCKNIKEEYEEGIKILERQDLKELTNWLKENFTKKGSEDFVK